MPTNVDCCAAVRYISMLSRYLRVARGRDYDPYLQGGRQWRSFRPGDTDPRHDYDAIDVPAWDTSPEAEQARAFARWKWRNPGEYAEMNNLTGNAETWFAQNGYRTYGNPRSAGLSEPTLMGGALLLGGIMAAVPSTVLTWVIFGLFGSTLDWTLHWTATGIGLIAGTVALVSVLVMGLGIAIALLFSPLVVIDVIVRLFTYVFSAEERKRVRNHRQMRRENSADLKRRKREEKEAKRAAKEAEKAPQPAAG